MQCRGVVVCGSRILPDSQIPSTRLTADDKDLLSSKRFAGRLVKPHVARLFPLPRNPENWAGVRRPGTLASEPSIAFLPNRHRAIPIL